MKVLKNLPNIWPVVCVNSFVIAEIGLLRKSLLTVTANILLVCRMVPDVIQQRRLPVEDFLTQRALPLFTQQHLPIHVDQRLFQLESVGVLQRKHLQSKIFSRQKSIAESGHETQINKLLYHKSCAFFTRCRFIDGKLFAQSSLFLCRCREFPKQKVFSIVHKKNIEIRFGEGAASGCFSFFHRNY